MPKHNCGQGDIEVLYNFGYSTFSFFIYFVFSDITVLVLVLVLGFVTYYRCLLRVYLDALVFTSIDTLE
jgi:hypothetical protein